MLQLQIQPDSSDIKIVQNLVQLAIESEIKNLKRSLEKTNKLLREFEAKYQVSSEFFSLMGQQKTLKVVMKNM